LAEGNYMQIRLGYELTYSFPQPTPMILALSIHYSRASDVVIPDYVTTDPAVPIGGYRDRFGNWCTRLVAPGGRIRIKTDALVRDTGQQDGIFPDAQQHAVQDLPEETLLFLLGSRYCETDLLSQAAWDMFGLTTPGWVRVQAVCDYVHNHIAFNYQNARATRSAWEAFNERTGVCRDYAHLAIAFCRCLNIPARYCTGYLGDIGMPPPYGVGDFAAWFEVYIGGAWRIFDARNNIPRIGRVLLARGRDACDVAIATTFGPNILESFTVWTDEVDPKTVSVP
jgi:transglutaminase-like putative cysteine protease